MSESETKIQLVVSHGLINKLNKIRNLRSHKNPNMSYEQLLNDMSDYILNKIDPCLNRKNPDCDKNTKAGIYTKSKSINSKNIKSGSVNSRSSNSKYLRYIPAKMKNEIWQKYKGECSYTDCSTNKKCGSKHLLEVDHIQPISAGGETVRDNLRLLCRAHNQFRVR